MNKDWKLAAHIGDMTNTLFPVASAPSNPLDIAALAGNTRFLSPADHDIAGLGGIGISRFGTLIRIAMSHPDTVRVDDLSTWDNGNSDVDAHDEAVAVIAEHLGILPGDVDTVEFAGGRIIYTHHESLGDSTEIDPEDLASWAEDFIAIADPDVQHTLRVDITERYEQG